MARYHDTGTICEATKRSCPLGLSEGDHIEAASPAEFEAKLAEKMTATAGAFGTSTRAAEARVEAHPWAGEVLGYANSVNRDPKKGDWVAYEEPYSGGRIRSGKVIRMGRRGGLPYVMVESDPYEPTETLWPEGRAGNPKGRNAVAVRSDGALRGEDDQSWQFQLPRESFEETVKSWDQVDFALFESHRNALTGDQRLYWDNPADEEAYKESWRERYAQADAEMAARRESGDLGPRRIVADEAKPKPRSQGPAKGSISSYRAMSDDQLRAEYQSQSRDWFDGKGRRNLSKVEKAMEERGLKAEVQLRPWD